MTLQEIIKCDGCGKRVDADKSKGWIRINANEDYSVDILGGGDAYTLIAKDQVDFCSPKCLCKWIRDQYEVKS
jgi:hypothetical protein